MPRLDRYWWLRLIVALAYLLLIPFVLFWYVSYLVPHDLHQRSVALADAIFAIIAVAALLALVVHACLAAWLEYQRHSRREAARLGNQDVLPLAFVSEEELPADTPRTVEAAHLQPWRAVIGFLFMNALWTAGFMFCADLVLAVILSPIGIKVPTPSSPSAHSTAHPIQYPVLAAVVWLGGMAIALLRFLSAELSASPYLATRIQVSEGGITRKSPFGWHRVLSWHDARLLEVSVVRKRLQQGGPLIEFRRYALYGSHTVARWEERHPPAGARIMPLFEQVAPAVRIHTSLLPRTLDPASLAPDASLSFARLDYIVARLPRWLVYATVAASFLSLVLVDRVFIVVGSIYAGGGALIWLFSKAGKRRQVTARPGDFLPSIPSYGPLLNSGAIYEMTVGSYQAFVFNQIMFVILGLLAIGFPLFILGALFAEYVLHVPGLHLYPLPFFVLPLLVGIMGLGVITIVLALRAKDTIVLADATGLRKRWAMGNVFLPWGEVDRIERRLVYGFRIYIVYGRNGRRRIVWPSNYFVPSRRAQEPGAILTTPDEMAAIVAGQIDQEV